MPEVNFFWDNLSDNILQERNETGAVTASYTTEPDLYGNLLSQNRGGVVSQYHFDPQGSTLALSDDNQQITDTYAYSAFGEVTGYVGNTINPFLFVAKKGYYNNPETNITDVRQRSLLTGRARWLSIDPLEISFGHPYLYAKNSPLLFNDPSGREAEITCAGSDKKTFGKTVRGYAFETDFASIVGGNCYTGAAPSLSTGELEKGVGQYTVTVVFSTFIDAPPRRPCDEHLESDEGWRMHDPKRHAKPSMWKIWGDTRHDFPKVGGCTLPKARFGKDKDGCLTVTFVFNCPVKCLRDECHPQKDHGRFWIGTTRLGGGNSVKVEWDIEYGSDREICCSPCKTASITLSETPDPAGQPDFTLGTLPEVP